MITYNTSVNSWNCLISYGMLAASATNTGSVFNNTSHKIAIKDSTLIDTGPELLTLFRN